MEDIVTEKGVESPESVQRRSVRVDSHKLSTGDHSAPMVRSQATVPDDAIWLSEAIVNPLQKQSEDYEVSSGNEKSLPGRQWENNTTIK